MGGSAVRILMDGNRGTSGPDGTSGQTSISLCNRQAACSAGPRCVTAALRKLDCIDRGKLGVCLCRFQLRAGEF